MEIIIKLFLFSLLIYTVLGLCLGVYFLFFKANKIDELLNNSKKGIRLLLLPGFMATWPFFIKRILIKH